MLFRSQKRLSDFYNRTDSQNDRSLLQTFMKAALSLLVLISLTALSFAQSSATKPFVLGIIDEIQSEQLAEKRVLNIYLPEGYSKNDTLSYPVIYLLDGSDDEDFIHVVGLVQFNTFPWINRIHKSIVVGIANVDRRRDFTYPTTLEEDKKRYKTAGKSEKFIAFLEKELQPYIEQTYKTTNSKTIIGQSLGGLLATEILLKKPLLFNKYIIISPSLWWDNESMLNNAKELFSSQLDIPITVYIAVGKEGSTMEEEAKKLYELLLNSEKKQLTTTFKYFENENHATILHNSIYNAFLNEFPFKEK